jgi:hypothetical protein
MVVLTLCTAVVLAQTGGGGRGGGILIRHQAPTDRALDFPFATLQAEFADMIAQKRVTTPGVPHVIRDTAGISYLNIHFGGTD